MKHGIVVIDKPAGMTSHDVVNRCRKILGIKKIGHTGTLDPDATGVLVLCIGQATKIIPFLEEADKGYDARIAFGTSTTTLDAQGEVVERVVVDALFSLDKALAALKDISELKPPQVSAVKVAGKKLYEYARLGVHVDVAARPMRVLEVQLTSAMTLVDDHAVVDLSLTVSKGSYIRSMVEFLGDVVGLPAHLARLRRTHSGLFQLGDAVSLESLTNDTPLLSIEHALGFPQVHVDAATHQDVKNGKSILNAQGHKGFVTIMHQHACAIYQAQGDWLHPARVFYYEDSLD
jgi:tRNA pseudouridine55 synthase